MTSIILFMMTFSSSHLLSTKRAVEAHQYQYLPGLWCKSKHRIRTLNSCSLDTVVDPFPAGFGRVGCIENGYSVRPGLEPTKHIVNRCLCCSPSCFLAVRIRHIKEFCIWMWCSLSAVLANIENFGSNGNPAKVPFDCGEEVRLDC